MNQGQGANMRPLITLCAKMNVEQILEELTVPAQSLS